jgi:NADH dehydrogenase
MNTFATKKRIVILGSGFGGIATARHLERLFGRRPDVEIILVSRDNFLLITPLLFEVFSGALDLRSCSFPVRAALRTTRFIEGSVQGIDLDQRVVRLATAEKCTELVYDQLVLSLGSKTNREMIPGSEHAVTFKTLADALLLRNHVIERFERADIETDAQRKAQLLTFVVIGGGLVGVELLGELSAFVDGIISLYKHIDRGEVRLLLLHAGDRIMPEIDPTLAAYGARVLAGRPGVELRTQSYWRRGTCQTRPWRIFPWRRTGADGSWSRRPCAVRATPSFGPLAIAPRFVAPTANLIHPSPSTPCARPECWQKTSLLHWTAGQPSLSSTTRSE